ncbi:unnamed protein product [Toxocara canis]|uniref:DNA polymerase epsilon catalytic subunit n=1 Tax=Toxocara canis TaxID=6265 RepID=A0A183V5Y4_TOXCA|nr:unnamed protein product [Toxocara canis]
MEDICDVGIKRNRLVGGDSPNNDGVVPRKRARDEEKEELFEAGKEQKQLERSSVNEQLPFKKKTIVADGVVAWIRYLKAKWKWQKEKRKRELRTTLSRGLNSLQTMVESSRRIMREAHWQLLQLSESATKGVLAMWVIVNGRMLRMNLRVPRIFYVNDRELNEARGTALNRELCAMRVEGIYESQVPIEFRALLELGFCCKLKSDKLLTFTVTAVELDQLEMTMLLYVEGVNDMAPQFTAPIVRSTIGGDSLPGQFVAKMIVDDVDTVSSVAGGHRFLSSVIDGDETLLDVDKHSGVVFLARAIVDDDLEMRHKHFNVSVSDGMFTAYTKLAVGIVASTARRSLPQFDQAFRQMVSLDYEQQSVHRIPLLFTDAGGRRAFSTLILNVIDENDNVPKFVASQYETSVVADYEDREAIFMVYTFVVLFVYRNCNEYSE